MFNGNLCAIPWPTAAVYRKTEYSRTEQQLVLDTPMCIQVFREMFATWEIKF